MKILTTNHPIIVNGVKESKPSDYLSADGIEVSSSKNPIIVDGNDVSNPSWYMSASGSDDDFYNVANDDFYSAGEYDFYRADGDDFYGADSLTQGDGNTRLANPKKATNVAERISRNEARLNRVMARIERIKARVQASGKPIKESVANTLAMLEKRAEGFRTKIAQLQSMLQSSASGDEFYDADGEDYSYIDKKNTADVKAFQNYANSKGAKLVVDGIWGAKTQAEYDKFGAEWEASRSAAPIVSPAVTPTPEPSNVQIVTSGVPSVPAGQQPTAAQMEELKKKGVFWDKAKRVWITAKQTGFLDYLADVFGVKSSLPTQTEPTSTLPQTSPRTRPLSAGVKIAIGVGIVAVVGLIIYSNSKNKN
jgi:hypothetical protein